jgi:hypothetical protein
MACFGGATSAWGPWVCGRCREGWWARARSEPAKKRGGMVNRAVRPRSGCHGRGEDPPLIKLAPLVMATTAAAVLVSPQPGVWPTGTLRSYGNDWTVGFQIRPSLKITHYRANSTRCANGVQTAQQLAERVYLAAIDG